MNNNDYIRLSLELHLFFDRIMKEHSFFLETSFMDKDVELKRQARDFVRIFSNILNDVIPIADENVSSEFLSSGEIITKYTVDAENKTNKLTGSNIDTSITFAELNLRSGNIEANQQLLGRISNINKQTIGVINNLIDFKSDVLNMLLSCKIYTTNYPSFIEHLIHEAKMYQNFLIKLEQRDIFTQNYIYEQEIFWDDIMKEHAEFIRGLLDPGEENLILTADKFADDYEVILQNYSNNPNYLTSASLNETINFSDFKKAAIEGILNCNIKSIIIPLLADHILREANHFIRILKNMNI